MINLRFILPSIAISATLSLAAQTPDNAESPDDTRQVGIIDLPDDGEESVSRIDEVVVPVDEVIEVIDCDSLRIDQLERQLAVALPYAAEGIKAKALKMTEPFSRLDRQKLDQLISECSILANDENGLLATKRSLDLLKTAMFNYDNAASYLATQLYDAAEVDRLNSALQASMALKQFSKSQNDEIEDLFLKLTNYPTAVFCIEDIVSKSNKAVEQFADIPGSENIAIDEIEAVIAESKDYVEYLEDYPVVKRLLEQFKKAKKANPFDPVEEVQSAISKMNGIQ